jgi:ribosomal protein L11 methyltransferase
VIRLAVRVRRAEAELALAELLELVPGGVEEVAVDEGTTEYAVYGAPGELPALPRLTGTIGDALVEISTSELPDDWSERWKRFHRPVVISAPPLPSGAGQGQRRVPALRVRASWEPPCGHDCPDVEEIVIDPGRAFGTGGHATTRLCLELLLALAALERPAGPAIDVGTGSGVLAIAAARLGFTPVLGLDHQCESVAAARANAAANETRIDVRHLDLRAHGLPWISRQQPRRPVVVLANLLGPMLLELAGKLPSAPTHMLVGGLLAEEVREVVDAFGDSLGLRERERRESDGWAAVWLAASGR